MHDDEAVHLSHCDQGEYVGSCKYGEPETCPALTRTLPVRGGEVERLREVLARCETVFRQYAEMHRAKLPAAEAYDPRSAMEIADKVQRNVDMADLCRAALATPQQTQEGEEAMCWFCDEDGAPCGYPPVVGTGTDARCEKHHEPLALTPHRRERAAD